ncbi:MarR family winged helix-turn-helix transcriptional regulator [Streptacidiphilus anmyonensis]|uniref:MarR family winged helix-turn-helix transcriptional regulator n=1 Tax=Streptacidiphilus anmyonensis TaxID=405782 RepID=UPI0005A5D055|nr:MarR family transcriptional regulator [Streptacidiphilus anmyonensis]
MQTNENWLHPLALEGPDAAAADEVSQAVAKLVAMWSSALGHVAPQLSGYQFRALEAVVREPGVNMTGLAEALRVGPPACSRLCGRLEAAGLLERRSRPGDRREVVLGVTAEGRRVVKAVTARRHHELAASLARMTPDDRDALVGGLRALHAHGVGHPREGGPGASDT